jgi:predicted AAA+ superfamily ATPase
MNSPVWTALQRLDGALAAADRSGPVLVGYQQLVTELIRAGHPSLAHAAAASLLFGETLLPAQGTQLPAGLKRSAELDLARLLAVLRRDWQAEVQLSGEPVPPLQELAPAPGGPVDVWASQLQAGPETGMLERLLQHYGEHGRGLLARHDAFRWSSGSLQGIAQPAAAAWDGLSGLERQLGQLQQEAEAFLQGLPAQDTLLYGPRGSGKSTAVRGLLPRYSARGLRMIEVPLSELPGLPELLPLLRDSPRRFVLFIDDLGFESGDGSYQLLKTLLDGTLSGRPANVLVIATSNRRHLLKQRFSDRPDPLDDDVHAWDTQQQELALADRFGRVITFPATDQRRYLELVGVLAGEAGLDAEGLREPAISFAEWGNGYSGRTARQFIDTFLRQNVQ